MSSRRVRERIREKRMEFDRTVEENRKKPVKPVEVEETVEEVKVEKKKPAKRTKKSGKK